MATKTKVIFQGKKWGKEVMKQIVALQTQRLIAYADNMIESIGSSIMAYASPNNMDRTGNLLDSLCYCVYYNGDAKKRGYFRGETAVGDSHLHEWDNPMGMSVNGHVMAQNFLATYNPQTKKGWEIFFAIAAPYWGYWEKGHRNVKSEQYQKWAVMTQHFDVVKQDLTPMNTTFHTYIPS